MTRTRSSQLPGYTREDHCWSHLTSRESRPFDSPLCWSELYCKTRRKAALAITGTFRDIESSHKTERWSAHEEREECNCGISLSPKCGRRVPPPLNRSPPSPTSTLITSPFHRFIDQRFVLLLHAQQTQSYNPPVPTTIRLVPSYHYNSVPGPAPWSVRYDISRGREAHPHGGVPDHRR